MRAVFPGMTARLADGSKVPVTDILFDRRTRRPQYLVLSPHGYFGRDVLAPYTAVWHVDDAVHLNLTPADVAALPLFDHYVHGRAAGLCSRAAWRYGANRRIAPCASHAQVVTASRRVQ